MLSLLQLLLLLLQLLLQFCLCGGGLGTLQHLLSHFHDFFCLVLLLLLRVC